MNDNINRHDQMRHLAFGYFEGRLTDDEEQQLAGYIKGHADEASLLAQWESEWSESMHTTHDTQAAWQHMAGKLHTDHIHTSNMHANKPIHTRLWRVAVAAAIVTVIFVIGFGVGSRQRHEQYFCSSAPYGSRATTVLPDGSRVTLNAGSKIRYSNMFSTDNRRVELEGEAYFEVAHRDGARFVVATDGYDVEVRGTKFYVSAYRSDDFVSTTLVKGSVAVNYRDSTYMLRPGERAVLCRSTGQLCTGRVAKASNGWQLGHIEYDDITLGDLIPVIERKYNVGIHIASPALARQHLYISLCNNETIDEVLAALKRSLGVSVTRRGQDINIEGVSKRELAGVMASP